MSMKEKEKLLVKIEQRIEIWQCHLKKLESQADAKASKIRRKIKQLQDLADALKR